MTDQPKREMEIISQEYMRRELVQKLLDKTITREELTGLHELDRAVSGKDIVGLMFNQLTSLREENRHLLNLLTEANHYLTIQYPEDEDGWSVFRANLKKALAPESERRGK